MINDLALLPSRSSLSACRLFESTDIDETREQVTKVMQPHELRPLDKGAGLRAHMDFLRLPGMGIGTIKFGHMRVELDALDGYHLLVFCLSGSARIHSESGDDIDINTRSGYYLPSGAPFRASFSSDCEQLIVRISDGAWRAHTGSASVRLNPVIDLSKHRLYPWLATMSDILAMPGTVNMIQEHDGVAQSYAQLLLNLLVAGQGTQEPASNGPAPATVKRAERFLMENIGEELRLEDVAMAAGVPPRTLLVAFQRFRNTSPMRFLRDLRLDQARTALSSDLDNVSVTNVALDCGFAHFGRFSQYYGQRFGELPSETLARRKVSRLN